MRIGLLASGRGTNVEAILSAIEQGRLDAEVALLVCNRDAPALDIGRRHGVPVLLLERGRSPDRAAHQLAIRDALIDARVDLVALAGFDAVLDPVVVDAFADRIVNIHPSLLPAFGGMVAPEPQAAALRAGVTLAGCTVHLVTNEVDAGPVLAQATVPVLPHDTVESLSVRILAEEHRLYPEVLQCFAHEMSEDRGPDAIRGEYVEWPRPGGA